MLLNLTQHPDTPEQLEAEQFMERAERALGYSDHKEAAHWMRLAADAMDPKFVEFVTTVHKSDCRSHFVFGAAVAVLVRAFIDWLPQLAAALTSTPTF